MRNLISIDEKYGFQSMISKKVLVLVLPLLFFSCSKNEVLFEVETFMDASVIAGSSTLLTHVYTQEVIFPYSGRLSAFDLTSEEIAEVLPQRAIIYPLFGENVDLDFIDVITINAVNPDDSNDTKEVYYLEPVPLGSKQEIELFPSLPDIKDFINDDRLILQMELRYRLFPPRTFDLRTEMTFGAKEME